MVMGTEVLTALGILALLWTSPPAPIDSAPFGRNCIKWHLFRSLRHGGRDHISGGRSRGYGIYYAITQCFGALSPLIFGWVADFQGVYFTLLVATGMAWVTIPFSKFLTMERKGK